MALGLAKDPRERRFVERVLEHFARELGRGRPVKGTKGDRRLQSVAVVLQLFGDVFCIGVPNAFARGLTSR